eukprot:431803_1
MMAANSTLFLLNVITSMNVDKQPKSNNKPISSIILYCKYDDMYWIISYRNSVIFILIFALLYGAWVTLFNSNQQQEKPRKRRCLDFNFGAVISEEVNQLQFSQNTISSQNINHKISITKYQSLIVLFYGLTGIFEAHYKPQSMQQLNDSNHQIYIYQYLSSYSILEICYKKNLQIFFQHMVWIDSCGCWKHIFQLTVTLLFLMCPTIMFFYTISRNRKIITMCISTIS